MQTSKKFLVVPCFISFIKYLPLIVTFSDICSWYWPSRGEPCDLLTMIWGAEHELQHEFECSPILYPQKQ